MNEESNHVEQGAYPYIDNEMEADELEVEYRWHHSL